MINLVKPIISWAGESEYSRQVLQNRHFTNRKKHTANLTVTSKPMVSKSVELTLHSHPILEITNGFVLYPQSPPNQLFLVVVMRQLTQLFTQLHRQE